MVIITSFLHNFFYTYLLTFCRLKKLNIITQKYNRSIKLIEPREMLGREKIESEVILLITLNFDLMLMVLLSK